MKMWVMKCHIDVIKNIFDIDTFWLIVLDVKNEFDIIYVFLTCL